MSQVIRKPLVVEPTTNHKFTVIFLHKFADDISDEDFNAKVLAQKLTKNHKTLREQLPTVRWVFPHTKQHEASLATSSPWTGLSPDDMAQLGLDATSKIPYITQIILQEAQRVGGLKKVILGGQGETAIAAHDAMGCFPEPEATTTNLSDGPLAKQQQFTEQILHTPCPVGGISDLRMAGFLGMHGTDGKVTRDASNYHLACRGMFSQRKVVNTAIIKNTPHEFIRGGYKTQTVTWDGVRIDQFAEFLVEVGVARKMIFSGAGSMRKANAEVLMPKERSDAMKPSNTDDKENVMSEQQKHVEKVKRQKQRDEEARKIALARIEQDRKDRQHKKEMSRMNRGLPPQPPLPISEEQRELPSPGEQLVDRTPRRLTDIQKDYAEGVKRQKVEDEKVKQRILDQIEYDKLERQRRNERERIARQNALQEGQLDGVNSQVDSPSAVAPAAPDPDSHGGYDEDEDEDEDEEDEYMDDGAGDGEYDSRAEVEKRKLRREMREKPWLRWASQTLGGSEEAKPQIRGQMTEAQMKALGLSE
ncbi:Uu.00g087360.m01.CDS01 [Anthostomella pinea]|uniref:Uu.00g087360.m01.CDS01 n=1 Tax=Anthostomella pinea TaxID=933095 RepID=A0AAI8VMB7_9PEZI|nr:Uu.00g087360.m01.CDS01 [Anthostomella pinea]